MTQPASNLHRLGELGFRARSALYLGAMALVWLAVAPIAYSLVGRDGVLAATVACGICVGSGLLALALGGLLQGPAMVLYGMLIGMFVRMALPLLVGGLIQWRGGILADAGLLWYLTAFYFVTLAIDTVLMVAQIRVTQPCVPARPTAPANTATGITATLEAS